MAACRLCQKRLLEFLLHGGHHDRRVTTAGMRLLPAFGHAGQGMGLVVSATGQIVFELVGLRAQMFRVGIHQQQGVCQHRLAAADAAPVLMASS